MSITQAKHDAVIKASVAAVTRNNSYASDRSRAGTVDTITSTKVGKPVAVMGPLLGTTLGAAATKLAANSK